ncbi:MAG: SRPBCC domain-containing protein [Acidimicrobiales bacterium]
MEYGSIEQEIYVDARPETVFDVVSSPAHIREWWSVETDIEPTPGRTGELTWRDEVSGRVDVVPITVVDTQPPLLFSFRWTHGAGEVATPTNSMLVTFELSPSGAGTTLRLTETGFRERGWEAAVLEDTYHDHERGWDFYLPRIADRAARQASSP